MAEGKKEISPRLHEIREFCASTTAHGLGRAAEAKSRLARIFWMLIFTAAFILSVYQISSSFHDYLQFPTQTEVYLVNKERLFFPAVTVCNLNPFKLSTLINTALWHNITNLGEDDSQFDQLLSTVLSNYTEQDLWEIGHQGEDLIVNCRLPINNLGQTCSHKNFTRHFDVSYGNCYTVNTSDLFVEHPGHRQGFKLAMFIEVDEYLPQLADSVGVLVTVHSPYIALENVSVNENPIFVAPGTSTSVSLRVQNVSRMDFPYNNREHCNNERSYSEMACLKECVAEKMRNDCGCVPVIFYPHEPTCDAFNEMQNDCVSKSRASISYDKCPCYPPCREVHFLRTVSTSAWPSKTHMPMLLKLLNKTGPSQAAKVVTDLESARNNMALLNIHYDSMTVTNIKQIKGMTWTTLLGDIGGQLGLFIGVSCITLVEFLSLIWRLIRPTKKSSNEVGVFHPAADTLKP